MSKKLSVLLRELADHGCSVSEFTSKDVSINDVKYDSRKVFPNDLFCCVPGQHVDGSVFARSAITSGAVALMSEKTLEGLNEDMPVILTNNVRKTMGLAASIIKDYPSERLRTCAVTGTNGKSTTSYMIRSILNQNGVKTGLMGTIVYDDGDSEVDASRTTPEGPDIQDFMKKMVDNSVEACIMEASSHGIEQGRIYGSSFDVATFTNLTEEHLDYHGDMENYFRAKLALFREYMKNDGSIVVNIDDPYGSRIANELSDRNIITYSMKDKATCTAKNIVSTVAGLTFDLSYGEFSHSVEIPFIGLYNIQNCLAAVASSMAMGVTFGEVVKALPHLEPVPGRMERFCFSNGVCAVVDYAHSPDALENLLTSLKPICDGLLTTVFGLGGERFKENRWTMGRIAATVADKMFITMDNPRSEDPMDIARDILIGVNEIPQVNYKIVLDREKAVRQALDEASNGDIVVISGKGPESFILINGKKIPYNDVETVVTWGQERSLSCL